MMNDILIMRVMHRRRCAMRSSNRRFSLSVILLALVGLVTLFVLAMRYAIVPLLVMLGGAA